MIGNKALFGLLGVGAIAAAWLLLPKDSKIKKAISDSAGQLADSLKKSMSGTNKKATPSPVRTNS